MCEIKFSNKVQYETLKEDLINIFKDINIANKIKFDNDNLLISIYFPNI